MFRGYSLGFCYLDLWALLCVCCITIIIIRHHYAFKKKEKNILEEKGIKQ